MSVPIRDHPDWNDASSRLSSIIGSDETVGVGPGGSTFIMYPSEQLGNCNLAHVVLPPKCGAQAFGISTSGPSSPFVCEAVNPTADPIDANLVITDWGGGAQVTVKNADSMTHTIDVQMIAFLLATFDDLVQPFTYQTFDAGMIAHAGSSPDIQIPTIQFYDRISLAVVVSGAAQVDASWWSIPDNGTLALIEDVEAVGSVAGAGTVRATLENYGSALTVKITNTSGGSITATVVSRCHRESG